VHGVRNRATPRCHADHPEPAKESQNLAKHRLDFSQIETIFAGPTVERPDDRPLGYEHEGRVQVIGCIGTRVVVLAYQLVELDDGEVAARPISLRKAERAEQRLYYLRTRR
jgi:uncharacterized protein